MFPIIITAILSRIKVPGRKLCKHKQTNRVLAAMQDYRVRALVYKVDVHTLHNIPLVYADSCVCTRPRIRDTDTCKAV